MPSYKLIYFNGMGRAELIRWLLAYGDIQYVDERFTFEEWPAKKQSLPFPKVPILMVDEKPLPQSVAIARYVAKEVGLVPEDNLKAAYCDAMVDTVADMMAENYKIVFSGKSQEEQEKMFQEELFPNHLQPMLAKLEKRFTDEKGWFLGDKLTWADLALALWYMNLKAAHADLNGKFPAVDKYCDKVAALPNIKAWIEKRPKTHM